MPLLLGGPLPLPELLDCVLGAGGGPAERGDVGAKGSSKIVSVWARRVFIDGSEASEY